tara:strand:- start:70 stop:192 length:123 start_codon:yes stop_codon:yes gene_type:complete
VDQGKKEAGGPVNEKGEQTRPAWKINWEILPEVPQQSRIA